jgi:hypothetical protein
MIEHVGLASFTPSLVAMFAAAQAAAPGRSIRL